MYKVWNIATNSWVISNPHGVILHTENDVSDILTFDRREAAETICATLNQAIEAGRANKAAEIRKVLEL